MRDSESRALCEWVSPQVVLLERLRCAMVATTGQCSVEVAYAKSSCYGPSPIIQ